jgi:hypothetical protein
MPRLLTTVALLLSLQRTILASPCVAFDINWNLLAFGFDGKDYSAGTQDAWANGKATDITTSGRPPFDGTSTTCYLSQFENSIYVLNADASSPSSIYVYNAGSKSWAKQATSLGSFDIASSVSILDHDTEVFYSLSKGEMWAINMTEVSLTPDDETPWKDISKFPVDGYDKPTMALASNHIHFIGVPNVPAGSADIFVIHFSYFQPETQKYGDFPSTHGQTASIFLNEGVQQEFIYVPDDGSATYIVNVMSNTTQTLPAPSKKDSAASYFGAPDSIVQLAADGTVSWLPYNAKDTGANKAASWSTVAALPAVTGTASGPSGSAGASGSVGSGSGSGSHGSPTNTGAGSNPTGAAESLVRMSGVALVAAGLSLVFNVMLS